MKLPISDIKTESAGLLAEESFGIGNIGLIFEILRNRMYKNPILAIAREITCNARDAHREVGKPELPIEIHLPNAFCPEYRVRDFGPGISPDRMSNVFIQYATSTKRQDNTQTGGFGLGAKTPFSYADTFSIVTVVDKVKRIYTAYIDESRVGRMALTSEQPTTEPNGTTIVVPVNRPDFAEFINCTLAATEFWDVKPILLGVTPAPEYRQHKALFSGTGWSLTQTHDYQNRSALAIVDGIPYKIEASNFASMSAKHRQFLTHSFLLHFNIGEISLAASRDSIYYDDKTQKMISDRLNVMSAEMSASLKKRFEACTSYREASILNQKIAVELSIFRDELVSIAYWQGQKLKSSFHIEDIGRYARLNTYQRSGGGGVTLDRYKKDHLSINEKYKVFYNDKTQENIQKHIPVELFKLYPGYDYIQIVSTPKNPSHWEYKREIERGNTPTVTYDLAPLDLIEFEKLSTVKFPKVVRNKAPKPEKKDSTVLAYELSCAGDKITHKLVQMPDAGGVYIEVDYGRNRYISGDLLVYKYEQLRDFNTLLGTQVVGFTGTRAKKLSPQWVPLKKAFENKLQEIQKEVSFQGLKELSISSNWLCRFRLHHLVMQSSFAAEANRILSNQSLFLKYVNESKTIEAAINKYKPAIQVLHVRGEIKQDELPATDRHQVSRESYDDTPLCKLYQEVLARYPLIQAVSHHGIGLDELRGTIDYINLIDQRVEQATQNAVVINKLLDNVLPRK